MASRHPHSHPRRADVLVIGYGNELRGDDALGPRVAAAVESWGLPGVRVLTVQQLTPDLALAISEAQRVVFLDASGNPSQHSVRCQAIHPSREPQRFGHTSHPSELMALARALYRRSPAAWLVTAPAASLGLGEPLSEQARGGFEAAAQTVRNLCAFP